jgi:hypothetical protein|nr:hypothetical protein [uncultured Lachnoclostridium sp.]
MQQTMCDICKKNEADVKIRAKINVKKVRYTQGNGARSRYIGFGIWDRVDICQTCYKKMFEVEVLNPIQS